MQSKNKISFKFELHNRDGSKISGKRLFMLFVMAFVAVVIFGVVMFITLWSRTWGI